jgi:8-oxo-dGTP pyrophosphatase MutT (NUDIX family)
MNLETCYYYITSMCSCDKTIIGLSNALDQNLTKGRWGDEPPAILSRLPTTSYGLLVFHWDVISGNPLYFLGKNRDSITYFIFLRGRYKIGYIERYFSLMSNGERRRLKTYTFGELWRDVCVNTCGKIFNNEREFAYNHWKRVTEKINGDCLLDMWLRNTTSIQPDVSWGFPKGRLFRKEQHLECAYREFEEETGIIPSGKGTDHFADNVRPSMLTFDIPEYVETFYGSDDNLYRSVYYLTLMTRPYIPKVTNRTDLIRPKMISDEMSESGWFTLNDALLLLEPRKQNILMESHKWILERTSSRGLVSCKTVLSPRRRKYNRGFSSSLPQIDRNFKNVRDDINEI